MGVDGCGEWARFSYDGHTFVSQRHFSSWLILLDQLQPDKPDQSAFDRMLLLVGGDEGLKTSGISNKKL